MHYEKPNRCKWANLWVRIREERADSYALRQKVLIYVTENLMIQNGLVSGCHYVEKKEKMANSIIWG